MHDRQDELRIKAFGEKLEKIRREKGLSLRVLALETEMSKTHIAKVEKGQTNPSLTTILRLADAFGIDPAQLFTK